MPRTSASTVFEYHSRTKHRFQRMARSAGYMDWQNQPDPFRSYEDSGAFISLPLLSKDSDLTFGKLVRRATAGSSPMQIASLAAMLELSLGLSAWKSAGGMRWALRMNPSSGNLHPTEAYLVLPPAAGLAAGVYHYQPYYHGLEKRASLPADIREHFQDHFGAEAFLVALTGIFWREAWKYGERAFRYCNLDAGHALAALSYAAGMQGWRVTLLNAVADDQLEAMLGFGQTRFAPDEIERSELVCAVNPAGDFPVPRHLPPPILDTVCKATLSGIPNRLSKAHVRWDIIDSVARATDKPETDGVCHCFDRSLPSPTGILGKSAAAVIRNRRSAVMYHPAETIGWDRFATVLDLTVPRHHLPPFDVDLGTPCIDLIVFVHNVTELEPGLYYFSRSPTLTQAVRRRMAVSFTWKQVAREAALFKLQAGDRREEAQLVSCYQEIAGMSSFCIAMLAEFRRPVQSAPYRYRYLHWEAGAIGQSLYLAAEAVGLRGTGIGCFFDDAVTDMLGLTDDAYQILYHFTVGNPLEDRRVRSFPPYAHRVSSPY